MKKYILIDHEPWTIRRKQLFYDLFKEAGVPLEVWDLSQWLHPGIHYVDEIKYSSYLTKVEDEDQFAKILSSEKPSQCVIVEEVFRNWSNRKVFRMLSNYGFTTIKIEFYGNTSLKHNILYSIRCLTPEKVLRIIRK